jgi:hypothetical protein
LHSAKCPDCGLVNFASASACKRCGADLPRSASAADGPAPDPWGADRVAAAGRPKGVGLLVLAGFGTVVAAAAAVILFVRLTAPPPYARLIRDSEQFRAPVTIKVNQEPFAEDRQWLGRPAVPEAYVLESLGLLDIDTRVKTTVERGTRPYVPDNDIIRGLAAPPEPVYKTEVTVNISLTEAGREAAAGWESVEEGERPFKTSWWRVPVGVREFVSVESVKPWDAYADGREARLVQFRWRWRPNELGSAFDRHSPKGRSLPTEARDSALAKWGSADERIGLAAFERDGEGWKLAEVFFSVYYDQTFNQYVPVANVN